MKKRSGFKEDTAVKLAEALRERADISRNIEQLRMRLNSNVLVQEGEATAEDPKALKRELDASADRLAYLISRINITNSETKLGGVSLTEMIAKKDALTAKLSVYKDVTLSASQAAYRARHTEIKVKTTIDVAAWQREVEEMSKALRLLDNSLQAANWTTDLME